MTADVITLIKEDHRDVEALFERLRKTPENRPALVAELATKFIAHGRAEEEKVYSVISKKRPDEEQRVRRGVHEHHETEELLGRLLAADPEGKEFESLLKYVETAITQHVQEEETEILPMLEKAVSAAERGKLSRVFSKRKAEELHPPKPHAITKNELLETAKELGVEGASAMKREELFEAVMGKRQ